MMKKTSGDTVMLYIGIIVLLIGASVFVYFRFFFDGITFFEAPKVSQEFVYQETKECNKMRDTIKENLVKECINEYDRTSELTKIRDAYCKDKDIKEIFYSPKMNECAATYHYLSMYFIRGLNSNNYYKFDAEKENDSCIIYENGEKIKKTKLGEVNYWEDPCYPRIKEAWSDKIEELKDLY